MPVLLVQYVGVLAVFLVLDGLWLGVVATGFYRSQLGPLLRPDVLWPAALAFYTLYALGVVVLASNRAGAEAGWQAAFAFGALLGLVAYGTYDLTNLSTVKGFPPLMAAVDLAWGTVLTATCATVGWWIGRWMAG